MFNTWYVYYDTDNNITAVTNEIKPSGTYFEVEENQVIGFIQGTSNIADYVVSINNLNVFSINKKIIFLDKLSYKDFVIIPLVNSDQNLDVTIVWTLHNWMFKLSDQLRNRIPKTQYNTVLHFYISDKSDLNFLYKTIKLSIEDLMKSDQEVRFTTEYETDITNLCIVTKNYFNNVGVILNEQ